MRDQKGKVLRTIFRRFFVDFGGILGSRSGKSGETRASNKNMKTKVGKQGNFSAVVFDKKGNDGALTPYY